jgi:hypothetical protein
LGEKRPRNSRCFVGTVALMVHLRYEQSPLVEELEIIEHPSCSALACIEHTKPSHIMSLRSATSQSLFPKRRLLGTICLLLQLTSPTYEKRTIALYPDLYLYLMKNQIYHELLLTFPPISSWFSASLTCLQPSVMSYPDHPGILTMVPFPPPQHNIV